MNASKQNRGEGRKLAEIQASGKRRFQARFQSAVRANLVVLSLTGGAGLLLTSFAAPLHAQTFFGSVVGTVTDAESEVIPGATVTITNLGTSEIHTVTTNSAGEYTVVNLLPAKYKVEVSAPNFKRTTSQVQVEVGGALRVDERLVVGATTETIEVTAKAPLLDTESSGLSQTISGLQVQATPLNGRNIMNMITLAPGVVAQGSTAGGAAMSQHGDHTSNQAWNNYQIGGAISGEGASFVDGAPTNVLGQNLVALLVTQDAIQEFSVSSSNANSDFGRYGGGVVNMTTKSGGNKLHGTFYEFIRNTDFNANDFFSNATATPRPKYNQNQFGTSITGPIKRDKAFFMGTWEGFHSIIGQPAPSEVPTTNMQNGIFSNAIFGVTATQTTAYTDPVSKCVIDGPATVANPHPGSWVIANLSSCGDPTAAILKTFYPAPNITTPGLSYNYFNQPKLYDDQNQYNGRVDYTLNSRQRLFARYTQWDINDTGFNTFNDYNGFPTENAFSVNHTKQAVVGDTYTLNAKTVLDVRASYLREYYPNLPKNQNVNEAQFGTNYATLAAQESLHVIPVFQFTGSHNLSGFTSSTTFSQAYYNNYVLSGNLVRLAGKHSFKFGVDARLLDLNGTGTDSQAGSLASYTTAYSGDEFANFLLGYYTTDAITTFNRTTAYNYYQAYYATDTWQASTNLTLDLGLRYELPGGVAEKQDKAAVLLPNTVDPVTGIYGTLGLVNSSLYPHRTVVVPEHHLFAPHFGFVYRLGVNSAIRGGYSISYLPPDIQGGGTGILPSTSLVNAGTTSNLNTACTTYTSATCTATATIFKLSNPFPNGINTPVGRSNPGFVQNYINQPIVGAYPFQPYPYIQQFSLEVSRELPGHWLVDVAYSGNKGTHIPGIGTTAYVGQNRNELSSAYYGMGSALLAKGTCAASALIPTITAGQCLSPYPYYKNVVDTADFAAVSNYNSLQTKLTKRFGNTGTLFANYTYAKQMGNTDNSIGTLETKATPTTRGGGYGQIEDYNNPRGEYSVLSYNVPNRVVVSYVYNLPVGRGQRFLRTLPPLANAFLGGVQVSGISTFQSGFPLKITEATASPLETNFVYGVLRPQVTPGCNKRAPGTALQRVRAGAWFNTSCFYYPGQYSFGNESRVDPTLYSEGIDNFDFAVEKGTELTERFDLKFRAEFYNLFNRVQFAPPVVASSNPNTNLGAGLGGGGTNATTGYGVQTATSQFGQIQSQGNSPRQIQLSLRLSF